jgi:hypothetical protein
MVGKCGPKVHWSNINRETFNRLTMKKPGQKPGFRVCGDSLGILGHNSNGMQYRARARVAQIYQTQPLYSFIVSNPSAQTSNPFSLKNRSSLSRNSSRGIDTASSKSCSFALAAPTVFASPYSDRN